MLLISLAVLSKPTPLVSYAKIYFSLPIVNFIKFPPSTFKSTSEKTWLNNIIGNVLLFTLDRLFLLFYCYKINII